MTLKNRRRTSPLYAFFLIACLLMILLVREQDRTIRNQQALIQMLAYDSQQLAEMKVQEKLPHHRASE
jgi:hypothetical protein